jgi:hypothetical protein
MPKLVVDLQRGLIEVDASDEFVRRVYSDVRDTILSKLASAPVREENNTEQAGGKSSPTKATKKPRRKGRTGGPSCASRIEEIKEEGFFKEPRSQSEIREKLKERGTTYAANQVAASLTDMTKRRMLRRFNENGWKYQNP